MIRLSIMHWWEERWNNRHGRRKTKMIQMWQIEQERELYQMLCDSGFSKYGIVSGLLFKWTNNWFNIEIQHWKKNIEVDFYIILAKSWWHQANPSTNYGYNKEGLEMARWNAIYLWLAYITNISVMLMHHQCCHSVGFHPNNLDFWPLNFLR